MNKFGKLLFVGSMLVTSYQANAKEGYFIKGDVNNILSSKVRGGAEDYAKKSIKNSLGFGIGMGYDFQRFAVDVTYTHLDKMKFSHVVDGSNINQTFTSKILMLNGSYDFYQNLQFSSFVTFGVGHALNKAGNYLDSANQSIQKGATSSEFAWKVGLGARYAFSEKLSLSFNYSYFDLNTFKTSQVLVNTVNGLEMVAPVTKTKLPVHVLGLGIKYKF